MRSGEGLITVARLAGVPIIPVSYSASRGTHLRSWDRFLVAKPFGRGAIVWGQPIEVARDADEETIENTRSQIEHSLNTITREADDLVGRAYVEPEPVAEIRPAGAR